MSRIIRYTDICYPATCYINVPFQLKIQIKFCLFQDGNIITLDGHNKKTIRLLVHITAPAFDTPLWIASMNVPSDKDSDAILYQMTPKQMGIQHIEIEMFLGCDRVGYMVVSPHVYENDHVE